jgi:ribosomal protein L31
MLTYSQLILDIVYDNFTNKTILISSFLLEIYCYSCKKTFGRGNGDFTRHIKETKCKPHQCHCGKFFAKKSTLKAHMDIHSNETFICPQCGNSFKTASNLKNHQKRLHGNASKGVRRTESLVAVNNSKRIPKIAVKRPRTPSPVNDRQLDVPKTPKIEIEANLPLDPLIFLNLGMDNASTNE